jgi:hypothetical protein
MMFFGGWMIIIWVVVIALIVWGVITLVKRGSSSYDAPRKNLGRTIHLTPLKSATPKGRLAKKNLRKSRETCSYLWKT